MAFLRLKTSHGHVMAEVYSCFQKTVRRGDLDAALYWGHQIAVGCSESNKLPTPVKGYPNALKRRLMQHALEDVGHIGVALALLKDKAASTSWDTLRSWIHVLTHLPKTRAAPWFNRVSVQYVNDPTLAPTPALQRGAEALQWHADGDLKTLQHHFPLDVVRLYKELGKEVLALHVYILTDEGIIEHVELPTLPTAPPFTPGEPRQVPDWALDKHTGRGKAQGRGYQHFFDNLVMAPRLMDTDPYEAEARELYLSGTEQRVRHVLAAVRTSQPAPAPPSHYTNILQAQLLTARHKARVWFAQTPNGQQWVVKGPVKSEERTACLESQAWKERLGLPHAETRQEGEFLVSRCLFDYTRLATHTVSSKLETNVRVPVLKTLSAWRDSMLGAPDTDFAILQTLAFRKIIGTNDTCHRNILVIDGKVYSIDDPALKKPTLRMWKMVMSPAYGAALDRVWDRLCAELDRWAPLVAADPWMVAQLAQLRADKSAWVW